MRHIGGNYQIWSIFALISYLCLELFMNGKMTVYVR
jgi:hypothetical protein